MPRPHYQELASTFLDLWQEQLAKSLTDSDFLSKMMGLMQHEQAHFHPAHAPGPESDELYDLRQRLAACERRIRTLEAALAATQKPAAKVKTKAKPVHRPAARKRAGASGATPAKPASARGKPTRKAVRRKK